MSEIRHQVTEDHIGKNIVVISALTSPDGRVLVETVTIPVADLRPSLGEIEQRIDAEVRMNEERLKQRI